MGMILPKKVLFAALCVGSVLCLSACMVPPIDLETFAGSEEVVEIIEKGAGAVIISPDVDIDTTSKHPGNLQAGNKKIDGLKTGEYYAVEEWERTTDGYIFYPLPEKGVQFVRANGSLSKTVNEIGKVRGTAITGLTNDRYYRVRAAKPFYDPDPDHDFVVKYIDYATPSVSDTVIPTEQGHIELPRPTNHDIIYYLEPNLPHNLNDYEIAEISINGSSETVRKATRATEGRIITTPISVNTVVHYVFFRKAAVDPLPTIIPPTYEFYVLKIDVSLEPPDGTIKVIFYEHENNDTIIYATRNVRSGSSISIDSLTTPGLTMPSPPTKPGSTFQGWWTKDGTTSGDWGTEFTETTPVLIEPNPLEVYARWDIGDSLKITVTYDASEPEDGSPPITTPAPSSLSYPQSDNGTLTFMITDATGYNSIEWYFNGDKLDDVTNGTFALNKSLNKYKVVGKYAITVIALKGSIPYSTTIWVEVTP